MIYESYEENRGNVCINVIFISVLSLCQKSPRKARQAMCMYSVTFRRVLVTIVALEKQ